MQSTIEGRGNGFGPAFWQGSVLTVSGIGLLALGMGQPAWVETRIGPGLMAQGLAVSVIGLGLATVALGLLAGRRKDGAALKMGASLLPGLAVLAAVALFVPLAAVLGLVPASAVIAAVVGRVAGDRGAGQVAVSAGLGGIAAFAIGVTLLPPTAPLWP